MRIYNSLSGAEAARVEAAVRRGILPGAVERIRSVDIASTRHDADTVVISFLIPPADYRALLFNAGDQSSGAIEVRVRGKLADLTLPD